MSEFYQPLTVENYRTLERRLLEKQAVGILLPNVVEVLESSTTTHTEAHSADTVLLINQDVPLLPATCGNGEQTVPTIEVTVSAKAICSSARHSSTLGSISAKTNAQAIETTTNKAPTVVQEKQLTKFKPLTKQQLVPFLRVPETIQSYENNLPNRHRVADLFGNQHYTMTANQVAVATEIVIQLCAQHFNGYFTEHQLRDLYLLQRRLCDNTLTWNTIQSELHIQLSAKRLMDRQTQTVRKLSTVLSNDILSCIAQFAIHPQPATVRTILLQNEATTPHINKPKTNGLEIPKINFVALEQRVVQHDYAAVLNALQETDEQEYQEEQKEPEKEQEEEPEEELPIYTLANNPYITKLQGTFYATSSNGNLIGQYLKEIAKTPLLKPEEEEPLARIIERGYIALHKAMSLPEGNKPSQKEIHFIQAGYEARDRFIRANLRLVVNIAKRYPVNANMSLLDHIQEGNLGLEHAIDKFEWQQGNKFSTYATFWIRQSIGRGIDKKGSTIHVATQRSVKARAAQVNLEKHGIQPTAQEDADLRIMTTVSLDKPLGDGEANFGDIVAATYETPETITIKNANRALIYSLIERANLSEEQALVVLVRYKIFEIPHDIRISFTVIGNILGVTSEAARRQNIRALKKIKSVISQDEL